MFDLAPKGPFHGQKEVIIRVRIKFLTIKEASHNAWHWSLQGGLTA